MKIQLITRFILSLFIVNELLIFFLEIPVVQIKDVSFNYPGGPTLFEHVELNLDCDSKIAIVGPNGAGR